MRNRLSSILEHRKKRSGNILVALLLCIVFTTVIVSVGNRKEASASNDNIVLTEQPTELAAEDLANIADNTEASVSDSEALADNDISEQDTDAADSNVADSNIADLNATDSSVVNSNTADSSIADSSTVDSNTADSSTVDANTVAPSTADSDTAYPNTAALNSDSAATPASLRDMVVEYAFQARETLYLWGGNDLSVGVDSSGFVQAVYKEAGYELPRTSREQVKECEEVALDSLQPGDIIFYGDVEENRINHNAIYIGDSMVIHASNLREGVKISDYDYRPIITAGRVISD